MGVWIYFHSSSSWFWFLIKSICLVLALSSPIFPPLSSSSSHCTPFPFCLSKRMCKKGSVICTYPTLTVRHGSSLARSYAPLPLSSAPGGVRDEFYLASKTHRNDNLRETFFQGTSEGNLLYGVGRMSRMCPEMSAPQIKSAGNTSTCSLCARLCLKGLARISSFKPWGGSKM